MILYRNGGFGRGCSFIIFFVIFLCPFIRAEQKQSLVPPHSRPAAFVIPKAKGRPRLEGKIEADQWKVAAKIRGLCRTLAPGFADGQIRRWIPKKTSLQYGNSEVTFWLMWDPEHLYVAARSPVEKAKGPISRFRKGPYPPSLIHDDIYEIIIDPTPLKKEKANQKRPLLCMVNALGVEAYRSVAPDFRPNGVLKKEKIDAQLASHIWTDKKGRRWWDLQGAFGLEFLEIKKQLKAGKALGLGLARVFQFPWRYFSMPARGTYMSRGGLPLLSLGKDSPYLRVEKLQVSAKKKLSFLATVVNPGLSPKKIKAFLEVPKPKKGASGRGEASAGQSLALNLPSKGQKTIAFNRTLPVFKGSVALLFSGARKQGACDIFRWKLDVAPPKRAAFLHFTPPVPELQLDFVSFNPSKQKVQIQGEPCRGGQAGSMKNIVMRYSFFAAGRSKVVALRGKTKERKRTRYLAKVDLGGLPAGVYGLAADIVDDKGKILATRRLPRLFEKQKLVGWFRYLWHFELNADEKGLAHMEPLNGLGPLGKRVNQWYRQGLAAGNVGDFYHNNDRLHSYLKISKFPQLTPVDSTGANRSLPRPGLQVDKLFSGRVIGNASMIKGMALAEYAYRRPYCVEALYRQYTANHLYLYVSFKTRPRDYSAYTPYLVSTKGASGSEQKHMEALFATLAAFRPKVKKRLTKAGLIAPVLQYLLRKHYGGVTSEGSYLSRQAHPVVFDGKKVRMAPMVKGAQAMSLKTGLPPVARLEVLRENFKKSSKKTQGFTTPFAVARIHERSRGKSRILLSAEKSFDLDGKPLLWRWVLLRGTPQKTRIALKKNGALAAIEIAEQNSRVDIALFVYNGVYWSPPAILSVAPNKMSGK